MKKLLKKYRNKFLFLLFFPLIWCLAETITPYLIKVLIDNLAIAPTTKLLTQIVILYVILTCIIELSMRTCNYLWIRIFPRLKVDIQSLGLSTIQNYSFQTIQNQSTGALISRYQNLFESIERLAQIFLYGFYPTYLSFFISLVFIFTISPLFAGAFFFWFLAMSGVTALFTKKSIFLSEKKSHDQGSLMGHVANLISNAILMATYPKKYAEEPLFKILRKKSFDSSKKVELFTFYADVWRSIFSWALMAAMIIFLSIGWRSSWITLGDFSFIGTTCFYIRRSIWMGSVQFLEIFKEVGRLKDALSLFKADAHSSNPTQSKLGQEAVPIPTQNLRVSNWSEYISLNFENISFGYDKKSPVLNDLSLSIAPYEKVGILGSSGVGKTSLIYLLLRLYQPSEGMIAINQTPINKIPLDELRSLFSYVPQHAPLLHRSIFENIALGNPNASKEEVLEMGTLCQCDDFINNLEEGYDTIIGDHGLNLSGGQRQRIAVARALLKKAPIFILDEATSGLDPSLEEKLLSSILKYLKHHTLLFISHRPSVIEKMDRVIELKQGGIISERNPLCAF